MGLSTDLGPGDIALDTAAFIYFIEEHPRYAPLVAPLFEEADAGERALITSSLTLLEVLVIPYRVGDTRLAQRYEVLLTRSRSVRLVDIDRPVLRAAAQLRSAAGVKTPDALQIVSALNAGCRTLVTNDRRLPDIPGLRVVQLSSYL